MATSRQNIAKAIIGTSFLHASETPIISQRLFAGTMILANAESSFFEAANRGVHLSPRDTCCSM
jgi:hypothetical protein